jgi:two-component system cell cycle sensor histidine kinase/response regulator CckA
MGPLFPKLSINLKLPLLVAGLLLAVVSVFALLAYRQVSGAATAEAVDRLNKVSTQLADLISQQAGALKTALAVVARDHAVLALESDRSSAAVARAVARLDQLKRDTSDQLTIEVLDRDGAILAARPARKAILTLAAVAAPSRPDSASISPIFLYNDSLFYEATVPLPAGGWVVERRLVTNSPEAMERLSQLIGTNAQLYVGNRDGPPWTDFLKRVDPPRVGDTAVVYQRGGEKWVGAFVDAANTPWMLGAEFPLTDVLASTRALLRRFTILAILIIGLGAIVGWLLSRQITGPLGHLTQAAEDVASGKLQHLPRGRRDDEIGRLGEAFRIMLERVREGQVQLGERSVELHRAEERVQGTLETMRAVFQASPLPIIALNRAEQVEFWNLAAERVFGWPAEEVIGKTLPFIPDDLHHESERLWTESLRGEVFTGLEVRRKRRDGVMMDMRLTVSAIYGSDDEPTGVVAVYEDITERRRLEDHLRHIQRLDAIGKLAGGVAHDFNNLLTVILTEAELGLMVAGAGGSGEALDAIRQTAERAAALTRQLLAFARRQPLKAEVFDFGTTMLDLEKMLQRLIGDHVTLVTRIPEGLWQVKADRGQIEQVVTNLVVNARDAMPNGGRVTVTAQNLTLSPADVEGKPELDAGEWMAFSVEDTGTGMTDDVRFRLFEPFFTTKEAGKGTGLGLATCHGIVQQSGGRIQVQSELGKGSVFTVQLPRSVSLDGVIDQATENPEEGEVGGTILLVEDYSELRSVAARVLSRAGYQVIAAESGEEAMRLIEAGLRPDLLVSDIGLPGINGVRLSEAIRQVHPHVKILLVSGSKDYEHLLQNIEERSFLEKPYRVDELVRGVRALFKKPLAKAS